MNKELKELRCEILKMHKQHVEDNQDHILKFEKMTKEFIKQVSQTLSEEQAGKEIVSLLREIQSLTDTTLSKNHKNNVK